MNLRWRIEPLDDRYDAVTILEMPEEWRGKEDLGEFAGVKVVSEMYPDWDDGELFLPGGIRSSDLNPIKVPHEDTPRVHRALVALEEWHRTGEKPVEAVEYGEFPREVGERCLGSPSKSASRRCRRNRRQLCCGT